jgi:hypothetical protein
MLYDKRWEKPEVKADPKKIETLIEWLEKQPTNEQYCPSDMRNCLMAQYGAAHGMKGWDNLTWVDLMWMGFHNIVIEEPHTFGGALERAKCKK